MKKLYNTQAQITSALSKIFKYVYPNISKPQLKNSANIVFGIVKSESVVTSDIVKNLKDHWCDSKPSSIIRRFERFFNNNNFEPYKLFDSLISRIIKNYKFKNQNVYIAFDHMYCKNNFTTLLFSLRIGNQRYSSMV